MVDAIQAVQLSPELKSTVKSFLEAVFVGEPATLNDERGTWTSSIYRKPVSDFIKVTVTGLEGDRVTQPYHGGPDAALCVHLKDHYRFWSSALDLNLPSGSMGENFTLDGIMEDDVCVGDVVRVGTSLVEVSGPRVPCANLARRIGRTDWVKRTIQENRTGFYMRVLEPGRIHSGDDWNLQDHPNPDASIPAINRCMYLAFNEQTARRFLEVSSLAAGWKQIISEKLQDRCKHWTADMSR